MYSVRDGFSLHVGQTDVLAVHVVSFTQNVYTCMPRTCT